MLKVWCRDPQHQFSFEPHEEMCWPTYRLAQYHESDKWKAKLDDTKRATQLMARFRDGHEPDVEAGLDLPVYSDSQPDNAAHYRDREQEQQ